MSLNKIAPDFIHGPGFSIGDFNKIGEGVKVGENVSIQNGTEVGAQPYAFTDDGEPIVPKFGVRIEDNGWIGSKSIIVNGLEGDTHIGKNVKVAQYCVIGHDSRIEDGVRIRVGVKMGGFVRIGKNADISMCASIRNRVGVGQLSLIGMGAVVTEDIPANVVAYGNPCRVIRKRYDLPKYILRRVRG